MFSPGEAIEVRSVDVDHDVTLHCRGEEFGALAFGARTVDLTVGDRSWPLRGYARGWHLAAFDENGRLVASYAERWLLPGRLAVGRAEGLLHLPMAWRDWTLRVEGAKALELDRTPRGLVGSVGVLPADVDAELLVGFVTAVVWLRTRFRVRPVESVHVVEGRAERLDELYDAVSDDGDGDIF